ncbi:MAG TPA: FAD-dependent oxidoreductase [Acidobacteriaceae bacterium]|nr:FAD-dependent oxidoreductase [Acidobacteriaceae bacterium]
MNDTWDVVIAGAGIVGAACAAVCAAEGMRTAIVESGVIGGGATAAGMGHIVVMDDSPAQLALTAYSQSLWHELAGRMPANVEFEICGTLWVACEDDEMQEVHRKHALYASAGVKTEVLDSRTLADAEPNLRRPLAGALLVPSDGVLYPPCAAGYLIQEAVRNDAHLFHPRTVLSAANGTVELDDGCKLHASCLVNAGGADVTRLMPQLPIRKRKGHLVITDRYPAFVRHQLVELGYLKSAHSLTTDSVAFNIQPRKTGQVLIGSSRQYDAEDSTVDRKIVTAMLDRAQSFMPEIGSLSAIRVWTGFRTATPDKLPLIGVWPGDSTLFLAAGHEGLGITTSIGTARLLVDSMLGRDTKIPIEPYLPGRFAGSAAHA